MSDSNWPFCIQLLNSTGFIESVKFFGTSGLTLGGVWFKNKYVPKKDVIMNQNKIWLVGEFTKLSQQIQEVDQKLSQQIQEVNQKLSQQIQEVDQKVDKLTKDFDGFSQRVDKTLKIHSEMLISHDKSIALLEQANAK
jgi:predicted RNase H-like nuclease (RuvC/YqgF family)